MAGALDPLITSNYRRLINYGNAICLHSDCPLPGHGNCARPWLIRVFDPFVAGPEESARMVHKQSRIVAIKPTDKCRELLSPLSHSVLGIISFVLFTVDTFRSGKGETEGVA